MLEEVKKKLGQLFTGSKAQQGWRAGTSRHIPHSHRRRGARSVCYFLTHDRSQQKEDRSSTGEICSVLPNPQKCALCQRIVRKFNRRAQEPGEQYDQYRQRLRKLADACGLETVIPEELLRDRLIFGIRDSKVKKRLLRESELTLADEICRASESMLAQMKIVGDSTGLNMNAVPPPLNRRRESEEKGIIWR